MKILHISPESPLDIMGGRGIFLKKILPIQAQNHEVKVLSLDHGEAGIYEVIGIKPFVYPTPVDTIGFASLMNLHILEAGLNLFKSWKPDVVHIHDADAFDAGSILCQTFNIPFIYTVHLSAVGSWNDGLCHSEYQKYLMEREQRAVNTAKYVHVCSKYYADKFVSDLPTDRPLDSIWYVGKTPVVIYNGVDTNDFDNIPHELDKNYVNVFFAGRQSIGKGIETLCEALDSMPDTRLIIAGQFNGKDSEKPTYPTTQALIEFKKKHPNRIIELGHIPHYEIGAWAKACDVWVTPSWHCPFELVGLEAMANGVPLVCTKTGAFLEYATDHIDCVMVEPKDSVALQKGIRKAVEKRDIIITGATATAQKYSWQNVASSLIKLYES